MYDIILSARVPRHSGCAFYAHLPKTFRVLGIFPRFIIAGDALFSSWDVNIGNGIGIVIIIIISKLQHSASRGWRSEARGCNQSFARTEQIGRHPIRVRREYIEVPIPRRPAHASDIVFIGRYIKNN